MKMKSSIGFVSLMVALGLTATAAAAGEVTGSGKNMFVPEVMQTIHLADGTTAMRTVSRGFITADDPANPLAFVSLTCSGAAVVDKDGKPVRSAGTCDSVDKDGDLAFYWWRSDPEKGGHWGFLGGTGKWTGVEGGGTYAPLAPFADGRTGNTWKGTWTMK